MNAIAQDIKNAIIRPEQPESNPWPERIKAFDRFSQAYHDRGQKIERRYEDHRDNLAASGGRKVNLFYSNVTVIKESLYNSLPKPSVSRLHKGEWDNEPSRVAATIMSRGLTYEIACAPDFDAAIKASILDRLVPGIGTLWVNFVPPEADAPESLTVDMVYWRDFMYEPQRAWELVTWAGRRLTMNRDEAVARWGQSAISSVAQRTNGNSDTTEEAIKEGKVYVFQMWDKNTKQVHHMTPEGFILDTVDDPYNLRGFFPCPKPLIAAPPTRQFLPLADYYMAQDQYMELDVLYARINLIIEAIKVAGVYDASVPEISRMLQGAENKLIPVDNWAMFSDKGGAKGVIDWFPTEQVASVLQHLVSTFEFIKTQLFEVSGMADIIRGSTNQYETAAAQQIKAQFASVRMNGLQRDIAIYVRDTVRIMGELMCQLYSDEKLSLVTGKLPEADQQFVQPALEILRNDYLSHYNVSIEADSLTQADWGLQQEQRMTYMQSLSQFLTGALPTAQANPGIAPLLIQMIKFASVGFKGSSELEGTLDSVLDGLAQASQQPAEEKPDPEMQKMQMEMQMKQEEAKLEGQKMQAELAMKARMHQMDIEMRQRAAESAERQRVAEMQFEREKHQMAMAHEREKFEFEMQKSAAHAAQEARQNEVRFIQERNQDDLKAAVSISTKKE